jgi:3-oxoacyl-[acyl-carrier-protein] synthase-3
MLPLSIAGWGSYLPEQVVTNEDYRRRFDISPEWIEKATGIRARRIIGAGQSCNDMAVAAAQAALLRGQVDPAEIDLVIHASISHDSPAPSMSALLQHRLGATNAAILDLNTACTSFVTALGVSSQYLATGTYRTILVATAEAASWGRDFADKGSFPLLGDGAGAVVLRVGDGSAGVLSSYFKADGSKHALAVVDHGQRHGLEQRYVFKMDGARIYRNAVRAMVETACALAERAEVALDQIKLVIPHQANINILESVRGRLGLGDDRLFINMQEIGNTSAATIPIALAEALERGLVASGDLLMLLGFGAGLNWGGVLLRL